MLSLFSRRSLVFAEAKASPVTQGCCSTLVSKMVFIVFSLCPIQWVRAQRGTMEPEQRRRWSDLWRGSLRTGWVGHEAWLMMRTRKTIMVSMCVNLKRWWSIIANLGESLCVDWTYVFSLWRRTRSGPGTWLAGVTLSRGPGWSFSALKRLASPPSPGEPTRKKTKMFNCQL